MDEKSVLRITQKIESIWARSDVGPEFEKALHVALPIFNSSSSTYKNFVRWMVLPNLCCQAAVGQPQWADDITAAWLLFYVGAHIMDSVEDLDPPDDWWNVQGSSVALNVASAFFFTASMSLQELYKHEITRSVANGVITDFNYSFLRMCEGQHYDLLQKRSTLQQYWAMVGAKSGTFFSIACRSGARIATNDSSRIENYSRFGYHLGVLIQILDDLEDLAPHNLLDLFANRAKIYSTLPYVFAMEVSTQEEREKIDSYIESETIDEHLSSEIISLFDKCGTGIYILSEIEKHRKRAIDALLKADPISPAKEMLTAKLGELGE